MAADCRSSRHPYAVGEAVTRKGEAVGCYTGEVVGGK
jgi:hypothetical protein